MIVPNPARAGDPGMRITLPLMQSDGIRNYRLFAPATLPTGKAVPLLIVLHSLGHGINEIEQDSGFDSLAAARGFAVAYPVGLGQAWNAGVCCTLDPRGTMPNVDDVSFLADVITSVSSLVHIDKHAVFMAGFSNGAMMAMRFACERPEQVAGIVSIAGTLESPCSATAAIRVLQLHGERDTTVPYDGTRYSPFAHAPLASIPASLGVFARIDSCRGMRRSSTQAADFSAYAGCRPGGSVELVTIKRLGHVWPTTTNSGFDTSAAVWAFMHAAAS